LILMKEIKSIEEINLKEIKN